MASMWPTMPNYVLEEFLEAQLGTHKALPLRWVHGDGSGDDLCRECAEKVVAAGKGEFVDGGWGAQECDCIPYCDGCGALLSGWLTDYGAEEELAHYRENPPDSLIGPYDALHIARLLDAMPDNEEVRDIAEAAANAIIRRQS